jgi:hypothetical protein
MKTVRPMNPSCARGLSGVLVAALACLGSACAALNPFGGEYELDIGSTGNVASQLQSLYVIVSPKEHVQEQLQSAAKYGELLDEDRIGKYTTFVQFEPLETGSWKVVFQGQQNGFVSYEIDEERIEIEVDHDLIEKSTFSEYCLVVLAFYGSEGFEQVTVSHTSLDAEAEQVIEVSGDKLTLRDA